jgi:hypothetical protein
MEYHSALPEDFHERKSRAIALSGLVVIVLAIGPEVRGFKPGKRRWILWAITIHSTTSFEGKVNMSGPMSQEFMAC